MATKRLSRTVLEAGQWRCRWYYSKCASRAERSEARVRVAAARRDPADAEQLHIRARKLVQKQFAPDKLGAVERWLRAQVGRPWALVEGEIRARFDTRSVPGRHIVFEHLLPRFDQRPETGWMVNDRYVFFVDKHGFLRARQRVSTKRPAKVRRETGDWLADRKIGIYGDHRGAAAYWLVLVETPEQAPRARYRQAARLDRGELERLAQLNLAEREAFVVEFG
jgi:hypothetical protein